MAKYQWETVRQRLLETYGNVLLNGEFVVLDEDEAGEMMGASINRAMPGSCYLERGISPECVTPTVPRHLGLLGFSSRLGTRRGRKYLLPIFVELPKARCALTFLRPLLNPPRRAPRRAGEERGEGCENMISIPQWLRRVERWHFLRNSIRQANVRNS
jgi:hypothetical protein